MFLMVKIKYFYIKTKILLVLTATGMNPEHIMLSEKSPLQMCVHILYDCVCIKCPELNNLYKQKINLWSPRDGGRKVLMGECYQWVMAKG